MQSNMDFNGATIFTLINEHGKPCGAVVKRNGLPDVKLNRDGLKTLAARLDGMKHSLTNATITKTGKVVPRAEGSVTVITTAEYKAQQQAAQEQTPAPQTAAVQPVPQSQQPKPTAPTAEAIEQYRHYLFDAVIKMLYGEEADVAAYKLYNGDGSLKAVDITQHDHTTEEQWAVKQVAYARIIWELPERLGFAKDEKYNDACVHRKNGVLFEMRRQNKQVGVAGVGMLFIQQYKNVQR